MRIDKYNHWEKIRQRQQRQLTHTRMVLEIKPGARASSSSKNSRRVYMSMRFGGSQLGILE